MSSARAIVKLMVHEWLALTQQRFRVFSKPDITSHRNEICCRVYTNKNLAIAAYSSDVHAHSTQSCMQTILLHGQSTELSSPRNILQYEHRNPYAQGKQYSEGKDCAMPESSSPSSLRYNGLRGGCIAFRPSPIHVLTYGRMAVGCLDPLGRKGRKN